jgi:hypothetical protein
LYHSCDMRVLFLRQGACFKQRHFRSSYEWCSIN